MSGRPSEDRRVGLEGALPASDTPAQRWHGEQHIDTPTETSGMPPQKLCNGELLSPLLSHTNHTLRLARPMRDGEAEEGRGVRAREAEGRESGMVSAESGGEKKDGDAPIM
ncbi:unnamed protein product [Pleuronectes platessa]|uniref:Uncharacterized protein n=1 Tax=Pleuronectes platessa TaxID=8262 RepID=A0A9N7Y589_PLEPL|nr:unnamed protein product [Pleuronectes platessa]